MLGDHAVDGEELPIVGILLTSVLEALHGLLLVLVDDNSLIADLPLHQSYIAFIWQSGLVTWSAVGSFETQEVWLLASSSDQVVVANLTWGHNLL